MGKPAYIKIKINHITDIVMVKKLYEAAEKGVPVDLLVRGNCSLFTDFYLWSRRNREDVYRFGRLDAEKLG